jgi:hypothetical protein
MRECYHQVDGSDPAANNITGAKVFREIAYHLLKLGSFWELVMDDGLDILFRRNLPQLPL